MEPLCAELRELIIHTVSKTGGHLASNLGTIELTVALHRVYDTASDRVVFDVGHQSYAHKILTGRRDRFSTLRQYGGVSGFPKPNESCDDAFIAGHASNSIAVALGMAKARTLQHQNYDVAALIGDGAMTGGLCYEGLSAAAASGEPLVIILNDNNMSIDPNVGGLASMLQEMRVKPSYLSFKRWYRSTFRKLPLVYETTHAAKEAIKKKLLPENMFNSMGFEYLGPVDGHDVHALESILRWAKELRRPVIVHVLTQKGKGYPFAEEHPELYHGVGPFNEETGEPKPGPAAFSDRFGQELCEFARSDPRITAITAAMASGTGLDRFCLAFPERFCDVGIAEGSAVAMAAGMAKQGLIPVFAVYSSFLQRAYDMLIHDVSLQKLHVVFGVDRAGLVGSDGETHHGIFDLSYLGTVPWMTVLCPSSFAELHTMLEDALFHIDGPVAVRYPRGGEGEYKGCSSGREEIIGDGKDLSILCCGVMINEALEAQKRLAERGVSAEIIKINRIDGSKSEGALASLRKTGRLLAAEEACRAGCLGERLLAQAEIDGICLKAARMLNLGEGVVQSGTRAELLRDYGMDVEGLVRAGLELCGVEATT